MSIYNKVLVILDPTREEQKALSRAVELAKLQQCKLTAFLTLYDFSYEMTSMLSGDERELMRNAVIKDKEDWIAEYLRPYQEKGIDIDSKVVWHNRPFEAIVKTVTEDGYDLVIKATHPHDVLKSIIFTPTDWHILRKSPAPVLLVKQHEWPVKGIILTAVNATSEQEYHQQLNHATITKALQMAEILDADVHLVNAYPATPMNISIEIPEFNPQEFGDALKEHHINSANELARKYGISSENVHVLEGMPEDVIPGLSRTLDVELVVIGTIGRTGLSAAIVGNTAEHIIDQLDCDVLALKPETK